MDEMEFPEANVKPPVSCIPADGDATAEKGDWGRGGLELSQLLR